MSSTESGNNAILLGASGLVGGFCLQALLADPSFPRIILLNRRKLSLPPQPRLVQQVVDFENLQSAAFANANAVFCSLGTTMKKAGSKEAFRRVDLEYPLAAAQAARQAGVPKFLLVSSVGADASAGNFYLHTKGEVEQELQKLGFHSLHIFRPSILLGQREEFRLTERIAVIAAPVLNLPLIGGLRRYRAISAQTVGKAMVTASKKQDQGVFVHHYDEIQGLAAAQP